MSDDTPQFGKWWRRGPRRALGNRQYGGDDDVLHWTACYRPQRPVISWLLEQAVTALAQGCDPDSVLRAFFGHNIVDLRATAVAAALRRRCQGRPDFRPILVLLDTA